MNYYQVEIAGRSYHSKKPLTYAYESTLDAGQIVTVPVRNKSLMGVVLSKTSKPSYNTKKIERVSDSPPLPVATRKLHTWLESYYPSPSGSSLTLFMPSNIKKSRTDTTKIIGQDQSPNKKINNQPLRKEQESVLSSILKTNARSVLLHGETGSGKTRVYAELAIEALSSGKSVLVLVPEIGLTAQLSNELSRLTSQPTITLHSQLTVKQQRERWEHIAKQKEPTLIVGTRSALFAPVSELGLIVVDEFHEDAYKQDQSPHYHAVRVAAQLSRIHDARLVLGSATPPVSDFALFEQKQLPILSMKQPETTHLTQNIIVDLKDRSQFATSPHLSSPLITSITEALKTKKQAIIYLNRRGTARQVLCQKCGWESVCPQCDINLTFHEDTHTMLCHTCGFSTSPPSACPSCANADVFFKQIGTKALINHVHKLFPDASIARFDTDLAKHERLEARYDEVHRGDVDILVGTQMLSKGLDLPELAVVGIVQADASLLMPDFTAREKTYQQLHQIIGRVGRGHGAGKIIVQTHNPESKIIKAAINKNYQNFYKTEIDERKKFRYPPFAHLLKITLSKRQAHTAEQGIQAIAETIQSSGLPLEAIGPSPAFKARAHGLHHWQIIIKSKQRDALLKVISNLPKDARYDIDPVNLL